MSFMDLLSQSLKTSTRLTLLFHVVHISPKRRALSPEAVQRVAVGVSKTLSSFTEAKKEGQELPTAAQLAQTATEALANVDISDQVATAVALRTAMQTLADKYLADARKGGKGGSGKGGKKASAPGQ